MDFTVIVGLFAKGDEWVYKCRFCPATISRTVLLWRQPSGHEENLIVAVEDVRNEGNLL